MARKYRRDARGRFAGGGYSGQSGGRGARLKAAGAKRAGGGAKMSASRIGGTVAKPRGLKPGAVNAKAQTGRVKASAEQKAIASALKKEVRSKNIQASRILMKMASKDGHGGSIKGLTSTVASNGRGGWRPVSTRNQRGNEMSASKSKELIFDRAPSRRLMKAAMSAADSGMVSQKRLDTVLKAAGMDYMTINKGYWRAVDKAKASLSRRRRR